MVFANVIYHEISSGSQVAGLAPNGTDSGETLYRGRLRKWTACTQCGLFDADVHQGFHLVSIMFKLPAASTPNVAVNLVDEDLFEYPVYEVNAANGFYQFTSSGLLVPPGWKVKVTSDQACNAAGRIQIVRGPGFGVSTMANFGAMGVPKG